MDEEFIEKRRCDSGGYDLCFDVYMIQWRIHKSADNKTLRDGMKGSKTGQLNQDKDLFSFNADRFGKIKLDFEKATPTLEDEKKDEEEM